jgi:bacterioferritin-associated ferredoxin
MIICICKNLNAARVNEAVEAGVEAPEEVHRFHGCEHQCGSCLEEIESMILRARYAVAAE